MVYWRRYGKIFSKLKLATQALEIESKSESWLRQIIKNPCVGGSIPPRATKNLNSPLVGLFSFGLADEVPLVRITSPLKLTNEINQGYSL